MGIGHELSIGREKNKTLGQREQCCRVRLVSALPVSVMGVKQDLRESRYLSGSFLGLGSGGLQVNGNYRLKEQIAT